MKKLLVILLINFSFTNIFAQDPQKQNVYRVKWWIDAPIIAVGLVSNYYGVRVLKGKEGLDSASVVQLTPEDINSFDRGAAKQDPAYAEKAMKLSDITLAGTFICPALLLTDKPIRKDAVKIGIIFLTTMSAMSNLYSWGVGHIDKYRPYVYNPEESMERRTRNGSRNSFYGGHAAAAASVSFFAAKVFHDYHPGHKLTPWLFGAAIIPPLVVGYFRYKAGMHFPSDILCGIGAGAALGIVIPQLHKPRHKNISFYPFMGPNNGMAMVIKF
jgi:membrane-associated phospholipid phosphatase